MKKKHIFIIFPIMLLLTACGATKIDEVSQKMINDIDSIGEVTLDDEETINKLIDRYSTLTDDQKNQVSNYATLLNAADELEKLIEEDNKPIELTVDNAEEYLVFDVYSSNLEEEAKNSGFGWKDYYYYYDVTADVSPKKSYYFEDVNVQIEWTLVRADLSATYPVELNDKGEGSFSYHQKHDSGLAALSDYRRYFSVESYKIKEISGKVYKRNPN